MNAIKVCESFDDLITNIGDRYFSIEPEDSGRCRDPNTISIQDCEGETFITIESEFDNLSAAISLVKLLNGNFKEINKGQGQGQ